MLLFSDREELTADVDIKLELDGEVLDVAQVAGDVLMLRSRRDLPSCSGFLIVTINGRRMVTPIVLTHGARSDSDEVPFLHRHGSQSAINGTPTG